MASSTDFFEELIFSNIALPHSSAGENKTKISSAAILVVKKSAEDRIAEIIKIEKVGL
jgi:hypothetical protein